MNTFCTWSDSHCKHWKHTKFETPSLTLYQSGFCKTQKWKTGCKLIKLIIILNTCSEAINLLINIDVARTDHEESNEFKNDKFLVSWQCSELLKSTYNLLWSDGSEFFKVYNTPPPERLPVTVNLAKYTICMYSACAQHGWCMHVACAHHAWHLMVMHACSACLLQCYTDHVYMQYLKNFHSSACSHRNNTV